ALASRLQRQRVSEDVLGMAVDAERDVMDEIFSARQPLRRRLDLLRRGRPLRGLLHHQISDAERGDREEDEHEDAQDLEEGFHFSLRTNGRIDGYSTMRCSH